MGKSVTIELTGEQEAMAAALLDGGRWADRAALCAEALELGLGLLAEMRANEEKPLDDAPGPQDEPF